MVALAELYTLLREGENSGVEFKRDDIRPESLAKELVALSNLRGGRVLLGVEDDGTVSGLSRGDVDEWVLTVSRDKIRPPLIPHVETVTDPASSYQIAVVTVEAGYALHAVWHNHHFSYFVRAGRQSRELDPDELPRLLQQRSGFRAELRPVSGASFDSLDRRRLADYFRRVRGQDPPEGDDRAGWIQLLVSTEFMVEGVDEPVPSLAGLALFGSTTARFLPQSGIDAVAYPGTEKDYAATERATLRAPLVPLLSTEGDLVEPGLVDSAVSFLRRNLKSSAHLVDGARRVETRDLPDEPLREALVNAVIHRDYLLAYSDVEVGLYTDRLEITSPGRLPNGVTVERMLAGTRAARNELLKDVMRDYGYLEHMGLGVPRKIVRGMREFNDTQPGFVVGEESLTLVLRAGYLER